MNIIRSRADYLAGKVSHREYYGQFVTEATIRAVVQRFGEERLLSCTNEHLNDIPLHLWDRACMVNSTVILPFLNRFRDAGDYCTLSGMVCIAKEAAKQWIERQNA